MRLYKSVFSLLILITLLASWAPVALAGKPLVITNPSDGETVSGVYTVTGGGDGSPVEVSIDYGAWEPASGGKSWTYSWDTTAYADGLHTVYARYTGGGNESSVAVNVSNGGGGETCNLSAGEVLINEILPAPSSGSEWVELYNTTGGDLDIGYCYLDDLADGGGSPYQIPAGTIISAGGFWTHDFSSYYNNAGDDVRLLEEDAATVLDAYTYGATDYDVSWYRSPDGGAWAAEPSATPTKDASNGGGGGECGTGTWTAGNLEIHHINIGQGDATLIVGPTGKSLLLDAGESYWNSSIDAETMGPYIEGVLGCKQLDYVLITHFHLDHIGYVGYGGLWHMVEVQGFSVGQMLHRDYNAYLGTTSGTFDNWKIYLEGEGQAKLNPTVALEGTGQVDLGGGVIFDIVATDGNGALKPGDFSADPAPPSENDYSIGVVIHYGDFDEWIGGDMDGEYAARPEYGYAYHDIEWSAAPEVGDVDVYRVNHHGSYHSNNDLFVAQLDPEVSIISVGDDNTYGMPHQPVMDRLLPTSDVYMTERGDPTVDVGDAVVAGDIVVKTSDGLNYTVDGVAYVATEPVRTDGDGDGYFVEVDPDDGDGNVLPEPYGGCDPVYQYCDGGSETCNLSAGQVLVNEILPAPSSGSEWVELYNTTGGDLDIGYCYLDDLADGGSSPYQIPAGTIIPAGGFWTADFSSYYNNAGDDVRLLEEDAATVLDAYSYGSTAYDVSWYRSPDGGAWAAEPSATPTKGASNGGGTVDPPVMTDAQAGKKSVTVYWDTSQTVDYYNLYRAETPGGPYTLIETSLPDGYYFWKDGGLTSGVTYYYVMTSVVDGVESAYSNEVSATAR